MADRPVLLITGTSQGLGLALSQFFVERGYWVAGCSRKPAAWRSEFYEHTELNICDERAVVNWVKMIRVHRKKIDALICNAAYAPAAQLLTMTSGTMWRQVMDTNVTGTFYVCREVSRAMMASRSGRIVTISSMAASLHLEGTAAYAASKSAIVEMTRVLARELASSKATCNVVSVSMAATDAVELMGPELIRRALEKLTIQRKLSLSEVCSAVAYFLSEEAAAVTGQVLQLGLVT